MFWVVRSKSFAGEVFGFLNWRLFLATISKKGGDFFGDFSKSWVPDSKSWGSRNPRNGEKPRFWPKTPIFPEIRKNPDFGGPKTDVYKTIRGVSSL